MANIDERINTAGLASDLTKAATLLTSIEGRHRVRVDGESFEGMVDAIAEAQVKADAVVEGIKNIGRGLFEYVERGINPTTGKKVGTVHLLGNEWDIAMVYKGGGVTSPVESVKLTAVSDENKEAAIKELVKVAVENGSFSELFGAVSLRKVDISTLPEKVSAALVEYGYKVEMVGGGAAIAEKQSYETPKALNKSGRGMSGKQLATQKTGAVEVGAVSEEAEREEAVK